jgi:D-alanyl-lipoteichoic acid acyltransferase DltB (MBOAT superfamily)
MLGGAGADVAFEVSIRGCETCLPGLLKMSERQLLVVELAAYMATAWIIVKCLRGGLRDLLFAALNIAALYVFFFDRPVKDAREVPTYLTYVALVIFQYVMFRVFVGKRAWLPWVAFFTPILVLIMIRYVPPSIYGGEHRPYGLFFVGISYLAFRSSYLVIEVRNGTVPAPGLCQYLGFCFFLPTMLVGPINPYSNHVQGFAAEPTTIPKARAALRVLVGMIKFKFLGSLCSQLGYSNLLFDDHYHHWIDLFVAVLFYYLFLYLNFSGFCDMAIGAAGLIGIPVAENFDSPFAARNVRDFWNRWHITLSHYMRDVVFSPLSKFFVRLTGPANANHAIAITIVIVFLLVGVWHGVGWNFAAYGAAHALGVAANHYYTIFLKNRLGREGFKAYNSNPWLRAVAIGLTFCYCAATLLFFANTIPELEKMFLLFR